MGGREFLFGLAIKAVHWRQIRESPLPGMSDRDFTRCADLAEVFAASGQARLTHLAD